MLLLLLLGPDPLKRGSCFVGAWLFTSAVELTLMLSVGHGLMLSMDKGSDHRTALDLLGAGALLALGWRELLNAGESGEPPGWSQRVDAICALPLLPLLGLSSLVQVLSPDDLFLYAKASGTLLSANLPGPTEWLLVILFGLCSSLLLLLPLLALMLFGGERIVPALRNAKIWLLEQAEPLVGVVSLALAFYLGWQGIEGLRLT